MVKSLTFEEIKQSINKLSEQYDKYKEQYGETFFNKKSFEERYLSALKNHMNMQAFIYSEVSFFEKLKEKLDTKKEANRIKKEKPFTKKVEQYLAELEKRWVKYPRLYEETGIADESQFFCGALFEFHNKYLLKYADIIDKTNLSELKEYQELINEISLFTIATRNKIPYEVESYVLNLKKVDIEKANMLFLKQGALLIKKLKKFLIRKDKKIKEEANSLDTILKTDILSSIIKALDQIIFDFRFNNLI